MPRRKLCVVTGTRAEYGLLYWLIKEIHDDPDLELQLVVTGMHLSPEFGNTYRAIEKDGFPIAQKIEMLLSSDTAVGIAKSMGLATISFAETFERLQPDVVVVLGDRYEILAAAQAAMVARLPIAHLHGGELTEGSIDEPIRHSLTKMSHFHFTGAESYRKRVIQLGEQPDNVYCFGAIGLDNIKRLNLMDRETFAESISFELGKVNFLVTYHPVTLSGVSPEVPMKELLSAFDGFPDARIIFTLPNADTDGRGLINLIHDYVKKNPHRACAHASLGQVRYLSALSHCDAVIGNSSSGLIEAPAMQVPTVNLGERQRGRLRGSTVIDCEESRQDIVRAIAKALAPEFRRELPDMKSPYGYGGVSEKIKTVLKTVSLENVLMKKFYDLECL